MGYKIGSARSDENFRLTGGQPGDQRQKALIDGTGEVSIQDFYNHKKGWLMAIPKTAKLRKALAERMVTACNNKNIGYSQTGRYGVVKFGIDTKTPCNTDCSSLVRQCIKEAAGKDPGDFNTVSEIAALRATGLFDFEEYHDGMKLKTGTILVTKTKGHTAVVVSGAIRRTPQHASAAPQVEKKTISEIAREVILGKWGAGQDRKNRLHAAGYDYAAVQAEVNRILRK